MQEALHRLFGAQEALNSPGKLVLCFVQPFKNTLRMGS
jgi:hypothetical protein